MPLGITFEQNFSHRKVDKDVLDVPSVMSSMLKKEEMKQSFCGWMPFLSPISRNHSLDVILSLTTKTPEQGRDVTPFTSALRRQYPKMMM